jgi:hypothetical protein
MAETNRHRHWSSIPIGGEDLDETSPARAREDQVDSEIQ